MMLVISRFIALIFSIFLSIFFSDARPFIFFMIMMNILFMIGRGSIAGLK
jgi:hypothetical protein